MNNKIFHTALVSCLSMNISMAISWAQDQDHQDNVEETVYEVVTVPNVKPYLTEGNSKAVLNPVSVSIQAEKDSEKFVEPYSPYYLPPVDEDLLFARLSDKRAGSKLQLQDGGFWSLGAGLYLSARLKAGQTAKAELAPLSAQAQAYDMKTGLNIGYGAKIGLDFNGFRLDLAYDQAKLNLDSLESQTNPKILKILKGSINEQVLSLNSYYDLKNTTALTPYLGAGFHLRKSDFQAKLNGLNSFKKSSNSKLGYQAIVGLSYGLNSKLKMDLEYNYLVQGRDTVNIEGLKDSLSYSPKSHVIHAGLTYNF